MCIIWMNPAVPHWYYCTMHAPCWILTSCHRLASMAVPDSTAGKSNICRPPRVANALYNAPMEMDVEGEGTNSAASLTCWGTAETGAGRSGSAAVWTVSVAVAVGADRSLLTIAFAAGFSPGRCNLHGTGLQPL